MKNVQDDEQDDLGTTAPEDPVKAIWRIYHSQKIWFTQEESNSHGKAARENLEKCDMVLKECATMNDDLEETLANTPKPSEVLDWARLW